MQVHVGGGEVCQAAFVKQTIVGLLAALEQTASLCDNSESWMRRFYGTPLAIQSQNKMEPPPRVPLPNLWVSW